MKSLKHSKLLFAFLCLIALLPSALLSNISRAETSTKALEDGNYSVEAVLKGGSGRVSIESPVLIEAVGGKITATFIWSSSFYEYMLVDGQKFLPESRDKKNDTTTFRIPLKSLETFPFVAQTSKMSRPYDIEYSIEFDLSTLKKTSQYDALRTAILFAAIGVIIAFAVLLGRRISKKKTRAFMLLLLLFGAISLNACGDGKNAPDNAFQNAIGGAKWLKSEDIVYAEGFKIDYFEHDIALIRIKEQIYLIVPRDTEIRKETEDASKVSEEGQKEEAGVIRIGSELNDAVVIKRPEKIYLTAPSALALVHDMGAMSKIKYTGTKLDSWALDYAIEAMNKGEMIYAGKYSSPDFEKLVAEKCDLSIFSTMITHAPEIGEKFVELGIPVFVDYSSYEKHPLGRTEWIKVYGAILNRREEAKRVFETQREIVEKLTKEEQTQEEKTPKKTVALFTISPSGRISARRYDDYVSKMIEISGGKYAYHDVSDVQISAMNIIMEPEVFFKETSKADIIIYNTTIGGGYDSIAAMTETNPVLADLPAIKAGEVWVTTKSFFQSSTSHGNMILELNQIIKGETNENSTLEFFKKLK